MPTHHVGRTDRLPKPCRGCPQEVVAGIVTQRIVRRLQVVEVDKQDRMQPPVGRRQRVSDSAQHESTVG
jgi:hypothetical protein